MAKAGNGLKLSVPSEPCFVGVKVFSSPVLVGWVPKSGGVFSFDF